MRLALFFLLSSIVFLRAADPGDSAMSRQPTSPALIDQAAGLLAPADGVQLQLTYSEEVLANLSGGVRRGTIEEGLIQPGIKLDLEKLCGWTGASFLASAYYAYGTSLTNTFTQDLNVLSNIDAYDSLRLDEVWFQQELFDGHLSIRLGLMGADTEFFIVDSGTVFLNSCFGVPPLLAVNVPNSATFPLSAPAIRIAWDSKGDWLLRAGVYSGDIGAQNTDNRHGLRFAFSSAGGAVVLGEVVHKHSFGELPGTVKLTGYYDTGSVPDYSTADKFTAHGLGAVSMSWDQALYRVPQPGKSDKGGGKETKEAKDSGGNDHGLNGYVRFGYSGPESRTLVEFYSEVGLIYKGLFPGRDDDTCGIVFSDTQLGADAAVFNGSPITKRHEGVLEATYQAAINKHVTFQPDLQVIFNPGGVAHAPNAVVLGARLTIAF